MESGAIPAGLQGAPAGAGDPILFSRKMDMALRHHCKKLVPAAALAVAMAIPGVSLGQLPDPQTAGGVEYVTGGFGANMSQAFREAESDYPLALTFAATDEGGGARPYV